MKVCFMCKILKPKEEFYKKSDHSTGYSTYCKICASKMQKESYAKNREHHLERARQWRKEPHNNILEYARHKTHLQLGIEAITEAKKNGCSICGYNKCIAALDFHHTNDSPKKTAVSKMRNHNISKLKEEISKCIVVCANCHREIHAGQNIPSIKEA